LHTDITAPARIAIMTRDGFDIGSIRSNVDKTDTEGIIFSRDCAEYEVRNRMAW
jgi:hypothetical protein